MSTDNEERTKWWAALTVEEQRAWSASAARAGVDAWELKKAALFDKGLSNADVTRLLAKTGTTTQS